MKLVVLNEFGHEYALLGLSLSYKDREVPTEEWWTKEKYEKIKKTAKALSKKGGGHNKFLESITVYLDIEAPRYWWSEFDTYRAGVTKQSESTMHKLSKRPVTNNDFSQPIPGALVRILNKAIDDGLSVDRIKGLLPESYLQRRIVCTNYKTLQNMVWQREKHRLPEWQEFTRRLRQSLLHWEYIE